MSIPPLPAENTDPWYLPLKAGWDAVRARLNGDLAIGSVSGGMSEDPTDPGFFLTTGGTAPGNFAPSVSLGVSQTDLTATASFTGSDPDLDPLTYSVAWGDGATTGSATSPASHTYAAGGTYTVTVTVSDGALTSTDSATVTVTPPAGPGYGTTVLGDVPIAAFLFQETTPPILDSKSVLTATNIGTASLTVGTNQAVGSVPRSAYFGATATELSLTPNTAVMDGWATFTVEVLIRPDRTTTTRYVISKDDNGSNRAWRLGHNNTGKITFGLHSGGVTASILGATTMVDNEDYLITVTYDGTTVTLYLNGLADGSSTRTGAVPTFDIFHRFGKRIGGEYYRGWIAGLAFYNRVLTPTEVTEHASAAGVLA